MKYIELPDNSNRRLPFYLAMEEWLARNRRDDLFFMWQVDPTVICGRNQIVDLEVDLDYCRAHSIDVCRRNSGGGCVFADRSNIMFSYITSATSVTVTFAAYTAMVADMLRGLGLEASATTRNDILINDRKVSGNAFYHLPDCGRCIVHGTMLYDTDLTHMARAITPSRSKLESKGVRSTASRITTIKEHLPISLGDFKAHARQSICGSESIVLSPSDIRQIELMQRDLETPHWIYRKTSGKELTRSTRIEGVGEFQVSTELSGSRIAGIDLSGDFFMLADIDSALLSRLNGIPYTREAVSAALANTDTSTVIAGLTTDNFVNLII